MTSNSRWFIYIYIYELNDAFMGYYGYLAVALACWSLGCSDPVVEGHLLQEGEPLGLGEVGRLQLAEVEFHGTVVAHHVWEKGLAGQSLLADLEGHTQVLAVLGEGELHFITIKVLK